MSRLFGGDRAYELKAVLQTGDWANEYDHPFTPYFTHNFPSSAGPYYDTQFGDQPPIEKFGVGLSYPVFLLHGVGYFATVGVSSQTPQAPPQPVLVESKPGYRYLSQGTFFVFTDYIHSLKPYGDMLTDERETYLSNWLLNEGFEDGTTAPFWFANGMNRVVYNEPWNAWHGNYFLEFNKGTAVTSTVGQDVLFPLYLWNRRFTLEAAVRCRAFQPDCDFTMGYIGIGITFDQHHEVHFTLPANDKWHVCRLDTMHGTATYSMTDHAAIRVQVTLNGTQNGDLDYLFLGNDVVYAQDPPSPDAPDGPTPVGQTCNELLY